jgi:4-hydroxy-tetrahydrodipicolinate synthase
MFFGSIPALVTPFAGGRVAEDTFAEFVEWQIAEGSNALVPCGTTGESATLNRDEHRQVIARAVQVANGRVPVIAGCGSYSTEAAIELVRAAAEVSADAVLVVVPYYNKPSQAGLAAHFTAVADASPLPVIVYMTYLTAQPTADGIQFMEDHYGRDAHLMERYGAQLMAAVRGQ